MDEMVKAARRTPKMVAGRAALATGLVALCAGLVVFAQGGKVTPVSGPSWLKRLNLRVTDTTLGRAGAHYGPAPGRPAPGGEETLRMSEPVTLTGGDLYRLNCQACHQAGGTGAPPEIKSVLAAVQGNTLEAVRRQLRGEEGPGVSEAAVRERAAAAEADLVKRIRTGGTRMPALAHLEQRDIDAIVAYIKELSHVEGGPQRAIQTTWNRVGEHLVKGTCHICHDASGERPSPRMMLEGAIPPLSTFVRDKTVHEVVRKVRAGAPVMMGDPPTERRGRMPVFDYVRATEVAAVYTYLLSHPPSGGADR